MQTSDVHTCNLYSSTRWGLPADVVDDLGARLHRFWQRFRACFATRTRDSSPLAYDYLRAQLTIDRGRNFANIERRLSGGDGQRLQHFMSNSPWSGPAVFQRYCQLKHFLTKMVAIRGTRNVPDLNIVYPKMANFV